MPVTACVVVETADWIANMIRSSRKPMRPMVSTATMMRARLFELPFWNSSQTNLPRPGFCASISAAISTIQPTPSESRSPVKISGSAEGSTSLLILVQVESFSTRLTLSRSLSIEATPRPVLISVGQSEQSVTVIPDTRKLFGRPPLVVG